MSDFDIAVIVPNFQRRECLQRACESILQQEERAREIVVVDDGSTVDLGSLRGDLESEGISWIPLQENSGPARARNTGVAATSSPWISFLDSDDFWEKEKLAAQIAWHREHPEGRISQVREQWVRNGEPVRKPAHWEPGEGNLFGESVQRCSIGPSCVMMHRSLWDEAGGFDPRYRVCEDYVLWLEITRQDWVGKVPGNALVIKEGGRDDQLSRTTPALDRYRVAALLELLDRGMLSENQRTLVLEELQRKCRILADGAMKRAQGERAERYRTIAQQLLLGKGVARLIEAAWAEIAE